MKNHKLVFKLYGVRRPLKWRMRRARAERRLLSRINKTHQFSRGDSQRWTLCGAWALTIEGTPWKGP